MELIKFSLQIGVSVGAAFLAAWLAGKRFRHEKFWERKFNAYTELIDALHAMKWHTTENVRAEIENRDLEKEHSQQLWEEFKKAHSTVWRIAESSSFIISGEVLEAIEDMERGLHSSRSAQIFIEHLEEQYAAIDRCSQRIKEIGRQELAVTKRDDASKQRMKSPDDHRPLGGFAFALIEDASFGSTEALYPNRPMVQTPHNMRMRHRDC